MISQAEVITLHGVREHNLKNVDLSLPRDRFIVVTGPSGSGKSSLAFDVLFAEGQRRYIDTLSPYARQFIQQAERADFDRMDGIPPAIAIEQRTTQGGAKTTLATLTEIWHFLRLLYARIGVQYCHECGKRLVQGSPEKIEKEILARFRGKKVQLLAPVVLGRKGHYREVLERYRRSGYSRARIDGKLTTLKPGLALDRYQEHDIDLVIEGQEEAAIRQALELGKGVVRVLQGEEEINFSSDVSCPDCGTGYAELDPRAFSFNSKRGWCPECEGYGYLEEFDRDLLVPDPTKTIAGGAFPVFAGEPFQRKAAETFARQVKESLGIDVEKTWSRLSARDRQKVFQGTDHFEGLIDRLEEYWEKGRGSNNLGQFISETPCGPCGGSRLRPESNAVRVEGRRVAEVAALSVLDARKWLSSLKLKGRDQTVAREILKELLPKLEFLEEVGLSYLSLDRRGDTLSGGESQRIRLSASLGSHLTGVLYVLDEPTIGLHPRDHKVLLRALKKLKDRGNSVVVVEHDEETIRGADLVVDLGPGAGRAGGSLVFQGAPAALARHADSTTGKSMRGEGRQRINPRKKTKGKTWLEIRGAAENNLKAIQVKIPIGGLTVVSGVSGSGKSTLAREVLYKGLRRELFRAPVKPGKYKEILGAEKFARVAEVDQTPIGRTPRSVPASYIGFLDEIRRLFAATPEARARGYSASRFSFNVTGGRCEACKGQGRIKLEMNFLPSAHVPCEVCRGARFNAETLEVTYRGKSMAEVLDMTAAEASSFFAVHPPVKRRLEMMEKVGLGYLKLGQESPTLSGGEAQRMKLVEELGKWADGSTLYLLDEPTTGLSMADTTRLINVMHMLVDKGDTVVVIEHNLDVLKEADWLIDLGPEGGDRGGKVLFQGHPTDFLRKKSSTSRTHPFLREWHARWGSESLPGK